VNTVQTADNSTFIIIAGVGGIVILLLIVIIVVQIRGKRKKNVIKRENVALHSRDHANTYCEIDDIMPPSAASAENEKSNAGNYESINETVTEKTKYTRLPTKQRHASDRSSYLTPVSATKETKESAEEEESQSVNKEPDNMESQVLLREGSTHRNLNLLALPDDHGVSRSIGSYIDMNKGEKRDEYETMEGQSKVSKNSGPHQSDHIYLMNDTYT
jgi:hypothetical protein